MGRRCGQTAASPRAGACRLRRRWATLPCPAGKGRCRCAGVDAVCPAGKGAAEWRAGSWRIAGESGDSKRFAHQGTFPARRGTGHDVLHEPVCRVGISRRAGERGRRAFPHRERRYAPSRKRNAPFSRRPLPPYPMRRFASTPHRHRFSRRTSGACAQHRLPSPASSQHSALPVAASSPNHPAGRPAGSARTRSRVQTLENPFLGNSLRFPAAPVPQKRRRRQAPARGPAAVYALCRRNRNETKHPSPLLVGLGCVNTEPTALAAGPAGPLLVGRMCVYPEPKALTAGPVGPHPLKGPNP